MDPANYQRAREYYFRLQDLPPEERDAALDALMTSEPKIGAYVRSLFEAETPSGGGDDLFERAIQQGVADQARGLARPDNLTPGQRVGSFTIVKLLGRGGFGDVYLAEQASPRRQVAVKIVKAGMDSDSVLQRFDHEREILGLLNHPNIARLYESGVVPPELGSRPYFAMEFVDGPPLNSHCESLGLGVPARLALFIDVCHAVQHAHTKGVMHRDIKPSNILVLRDDGKATPKVIDFGIAKALDHRMSAGVQHTMEGQLIGTLAYMSPEQAGAGDVDTRTDVYALGVVLYELLTGSLPFNARTLADVPPTEAQRIIRETQPQKPSTRLTSKSGPRAKEARDRVADARALRSELDWIVMRCLEKEPGRRYASPDALAEDLRRYLNKEPVLARPPSTMYQMRKFARKHRVPVVSAAFVMLALVGVMVVLGLGLNEYRVQTAELQSKNDELAEVNTENARINENQARTNVVLEQQSEELKQKTRALEEALAEKSQLVDDKTMIAEQEHEAKVAAEAARAEAEGAQAQAEAARAELAEANAKLKETLGERDDALELVNAEKERAEISERMAKAEAERADKEAENSRTLYNRLENAMQSVSSLTRADRVSTDLLRQLTAALDTDSLLSAQLLQHLAQRALADADWSKAADLQLESFSSYRAVLGSDHPTTLRSKLDLVDMLQRAGKTDQAARQLNELVDAAERSLGPDHPMRIDIKLAHAFSSYYDQRYSDAMAQINIVVDDLESRYGIYDQHTLSAVRRRGMIHDAMKNATQAEADYRRVLTEDKPASDRGREDLVIAANNLAVILRKDGRHDKAEFVLDQAVKHARSVWGGNNWRTAMVDAQHASALAAVGKFEQAEGKLLEAHEILSRTLTPKHIETKAVAREILFLYEAWDATEGTTRHVSKARHWQGVINLR